MPVKRCGPLKLVKRKKEVSDANKNDENCYSSPIKKIKSVSSQKVIHWLKCTILSCLVCRYLFNYFKLLVLLKKIKNNNSVHFLMIFFLNCKFNNAS